MSHPAHDYQTKELPWLNQTRQRPVLDDAEGPRIGQAARKAIELG